MVKINKISRVHHYIPQFHLKGFLNDDSKTFFVFDKKLNKIRETKTKDVLFEKDRNTVILNNGEKSDFLEKAYSDIEYVALKIFDDIRTQKSSKVFSYEDKLALSLYVTTLYWRIPSSDNVFNQKIEKDRFNSASFKLLRKDGKSISEKDVNRALSDEAMRKAYRLALSFEPFYNKKFTKKISGWSFLFNDPGYFMISDNPIIKRDGAVKADIPDQFVLPLTKECLLINNEIMPTENMPDYFYIQMGVVMLYQSERFICCHNKLLLEAIVKYYNDVYIRFNKTDLINSDFFEMLDRKADFGI